MKSKTILAFPFALLLGSTHPIVAVARELKSLGHRVIFASSGKFMQYVQEAGFETVEISDLDYEWFTKHVNKGSMGYHTEETLNKFVEEELQIINRLNPDLLLTIHRPSLKVSAKISGIKKVSLVDVIFTSRYKGEFTVPEAHPLGFLNSPIIPKFINVSISQIARKYYFDKWLKPYNNILNKFGHSGLKSYGELFEGDLTLFMDAEEFSGKVFNMDKAKLHFVGPVLHTMESTAPDWYKKLDTTKPIIFVSMGSSGVLFPKIIKYLWNLYRNDTSVQIVATTALNHKKPDLDFPDHFFFTDYIPADLILKLPNCILSIIHGGRGSIYHALKYGVPLLGIPHQGEQQWNLEMVHKLGLGRHILQRHLNFSSFQKELKKFLVYETKFKKNCAIFSKKLKKYKGAKRSAFLINKFLHTVNSQEQFLLSPSNKQIEINSVTLQVNY